MIWKAEAIFFLGIKLLLFKFMFCRGGIGAGFKDKDWCLWEKWLREVAQEIQKKKKKKISQETEYTQETVGLFLQLGANVLFKVWRKNAYQFAFPPKFLFLSSMVSIHYFFNKNCTIAYCLQSSYQVLEIQTWARMVKNGKISVLKIIFF